MPMESQQNIPAKTDAYNLTIIYAWVVEEWCKSKINFVKFNLDNIINILNVEKTKTKELQIGADCKRIVLVYYRYQFYQLFLLIIQFITDRILYI